jgi:hypothetical protein
VGRQDRDQEPLLYEIKLDDVIAKNHLLRRMNVFVTGALAPPAPGALLGRDRPNVARSGNSRSGS